MTQGVKGTAKHGTPARYTSGKCRCDDCRAAMAVSIAEWRAKNQDKVRASQARHYSTNTEAIKARRRTPEARAKHSAAERERRRRPEVRAKINEGQRQRYLRERETKAEEFRERNREWYAAHPEVAAAGQARRRARLKGAVVERVYRSVVFERDEGICQLCHTPIGEAKWHLDHRVPLARGGEHSYANVQLAHAFCNLSKGAKVPT